MDKIEELLTRGVEKVYPSKEKLEKVLRGGKKLKLYQGFDPTDAQLHIGHMVGLMKLKQWQDLGHHVIFLIGDFTAMVGDPSGKYSTRKVLTHEETLKNAKDYKTQASKILDFDGKNPAEVLFNGDWLGKLSAIEFLRIARNLTYSQVVERDMFQERLKQGQDVYTNEFLYPVMQAYDSVAMNVDLEIGGKDQMFNMLMGRKLMRQMLKKEKFVMTTVLLEDSEGKKIGKTEGNVIALTEEPSDLFGKIMAFPDEVIIKCFECLTVIPMSEITSMQDAIQEGKNPIIFKKRLAFEIVKQLNNERQAQEAQEEFERSIQNRAKATSAPTPSPEIPEGEWKTADIHIAAGTASSMAEAKRLITSGATTIRGPVDFKPFTPLDPTQKIKLTDQNFIEVGKKRFIKIKK